MKTTNTAPSATVKKPLTTPAHTPAPWSTDGRFVLSGTSAGSPYIADCLPGQNYRSLGSTVANARLIAAAPELLAALEVVLDEMDSRFNCEIATPAELAAFQAGRAAMSKATAAPETGTHTRGAQ